MGLITRIVPPNQKGSKLTFQEMDNNLYYLQSLGYTGATYVDNVLTLTNPTGGTITTKINTSSRNVIPSGTTITIEDDYQYFVFGDLVVQGVLNVKPNAEVITLNGDLILSGGTINLSGTSQQVTFPELNTFVTGATLNQVNDDVTFTGNFGFSSFTLDLSPIRFTGGTISGETTFTGGLSATTLSATTIDLCSTNGTLYTDSISGCSPINFLSESVFQNGLTATTISGGTFYGDGSNLTGVTTQDVFVTGGTYSSGTATFTNNTGGTFNVTGFTSGGGVSGDYLPLSGGTVTGNTTFTQSLSANTVNNLTINRGKSDDTSSVAIGSDSLINTQLGCYDNIALGRNALKFTNNGYANIALGLNALSANTSGVQNIAMGYNSLSQNQNGQSNIGLGYGSLKKNQSSNNIGIGVQTLYNNTNGYNNVSLGVQSLYANTTGDKNVSIGHQGLIDNVTGNANTAIGNQTQSGNFSNSIILGSNATATGNNQIVIGSNSVPVGPVTNEVSGSTKTLTVIINGVQQKILLA